MMNAALSAAAASAANSMAASASGMARLKFARNSCKQRIMRYSTATGSLRSRPFGMTKPADRKIRAARGP